jgi:hypothetical protein
MSLSFWLAMDENQIDGLLARKRWPSDATSLPLQMNWNFTTSN